MARLTDQEKQDIVRYLEADKPLPDSNRFLLFEEKREVELVWNGKTNEVCNIVLSFQVIEQDGASDSGKVQGIQKPPSNHVIKKLEELFTNSFSVGVIHFSHEGQSCNGWVVEGAPHDQGCNPNLPA